MVSRGQRWLLYLPLALVMLPFLLWPALSGLFFSFTNYAPGQIHLRWLGWQNFASLFSDPLFRAAWRNVLVYTLLSVVFELAIGFGLAYLLYEPFRGRGFVRVLLLVPWLVSPVASGVMWYFLLNLQAGIPNFFRSLLGLATLPSPLGLPALALPTAIATGIWRDAPLAGFLLLPGLLAIPAADWEYARLEGANLLGRLWHIALPRLRPLLLAVALLLTGDALGAFDTILILTGGGPGSATMTPALYSYQQAFQYNNWPLGAASAWFIVLSVIVVGVVYLGLIRTEGS